MNRFLEIVSETDTIIFDDFLILLRFLITGVILPEIIYISLKLMNFSELYSQIGHTLLFAIFLLIFVMIFTKRNTKLRRNFLLIAIGVFFHLLFDFMWLRQEILFFPLQFENRDTFIFNASTLFIQEVIGLVYLIPKLNSKEKIKRLFNEGVI